MALCPSCGALTEADPCPQCGSALDPGASPALVAAVGLLWFVSVLGAITGLRILQGPTPVKSPASGLLFFLPLLLALGVTLLWLRRARERAEKSS